MFVGCGPFNFTLIGKNITRNDVYLPYDMTIDELKKFILDVFQFDHILADSIKFLFKSKILVSYRLFSDFNIPPYATILFYIPGKYQGLIK